MGMTYFLSSASWTATAGHINSPNGTLQPPKYVIIIFILLEIREEGIGSFWLFNRFLSGFVSRHLLGVREDHSLLLVGGNNFFNSSNVGVEIFIFLTVIIITPTPQRT